MIFNLAHGGGQRAAHAHHRDLEVQVEGSNVHVAGFDDGDLVLHREVLGVQHKRSRVEIDLYPGPL